MKMMKLEFEEYIIDVVEQSSRALGGRLDISSIRWIGRPAGKDRVKDATLAFYVDGNRRVDDAVLLVSNPSFGQTVSMDIECAREVAMRVDHEVGKHISRPIHEGKFGNQTYAFFYRLSPLSNNRIVRRLQKPAAIRKVAPWLAYLAEQTKQEKYESIDYDLLFIKPLIGISQDKDISKNVRHCAKDVLKRIEMERPKLFTVVQHGDFWAGNVFFERRILENVNPLLGDFAVIDWRGMRLDGYPFMDLVRFCLSLYKVDAPQNAVMLREYGEHLCIPEDDVSVYLMLALGRLGAELDQFPKERYCAMCDTIFGFIQNHVVRG